MHVRLLLSTGGGGLSIRGRVAELAGRWAAIEIAGFKERSEKKLWWDFIAQVFESRRLWLEGEDVELKEQI